MPPRRSKQDSDIPRPPNAWILYRSDKLKEMPPPLPGMPRRTQAQNSKEIAVMWKHETKEVRNHYERLSDIKKEEHRLAYPDYQFQPKKRAEKERIKAERLAEKERDRLARKAHKTKPRSHPYTFVPRPRPSGTSSASAVSAPQADQVHPAAIPVPPSGCSWFPSGASTSYLPPPVTEQWTHPSTTSDPWLSEAGPSTLYHLPPSAQYTTDELTPPTERSPTSHWSSPSPYPPLPSTSSLLPVIAPQSAAQHPTGALELLQTDQWELQPPGILQEYMPVFVPAVSQPQPLGWSPGDNFDNEQIEAPGDLYPSADPYDFSVSLDEANVNQEDPFSVAMGAENRLAMEDLFPAYDHHNGEGILDFLDGDVCGQGDDTIGEAGLTADIPTSEANHAIPYAPPAGASKSCRRVAGQW